MFKKLRDRLDRDRFTKALEEGVFGKKLDSRYTNNAIQNSARKADNSGHTGYTSINKGWVHDSEIIKNAWTDVNSPVAREGMAQYQEYANVITCRVAELVTRHGITIFNKRKEETDELIPHKVANFWWEQHEMDRVLKKGIEKVREQGLICYTRNPRYLVDPSSELYARIFTMRQISMIQDQFNGIAGTITGYEQRYNSSMPFTLNVGEYLLFDPKDTDNGLGISDLACVWNKLLALECIGTSLEVFLERLGNGFLHVDLPDGTSPESRTYIKNAIKNIRSELGILTESNGTQKATMNMITPTTNAIFNQILDSYKQDIATGVQLPMDLFVNKELDLSKYFTQIQALATKYISLVLRILKFEGIIKNYNEVEISFNIGKPTLEIEKQQAEIARNSAIAGKTWLTPNEKRLRDHLEPLEGGDTLPELNFNKPRIGEVNDRGFLSYSDGSDSEKDTKPKQFEKKQELEDRKVLPVEFKEESRADQFDREEAKRKSLVNQGKKKLDSLVQAEIERLFEEFDQTSINTLAKQYNLSPSTAKKIWENRKPKEKDYALKLDSYQVGNNRIVFENAIMLAPNELPPTDYFESYEMLTAAEIAKWFNDPNITKELNLGIEYEANHNGGQVEVRRLESVGTIKALELKDGRVYAKGTIDLAKIDQILGSDNWFSFVIKNKAPINLSAGMWVKEKYISSQLINRENIDVRSVMIVQQGRNSQTQIKVN